MENWHKSMASVYPPRLEHNSCHTETTYCWQDLCSRRGGYTDAIDLCQFSIQTMFMSMNQISDPMRSYDLCPQKFLKRCVNEYRRNHMVNSQMNQMKTTNQYCLPKESGPPYHNQVYLKAVINSLLRIPMNSAPKYAGCGTTNPYIPLYCQTFLPSSESIWGAAGCIVWAILVGNGPVWLLPKRTGHTKHTSAPLIASRYVRKASRYTGIDALVVPQPASIVARFM